MTLPAAALSPRVASVPAAHPYVTGLGLASVGVRVLEDPPVAGAPAGQWWPPAMLDAGWVRAHADCFDVLHIHFGMESLTEDELARTLDSLREVGRPLVYTVHDLSHPQLEDQRRHLAQLDRAVPAADALITLTDGAAVEVDRRWGRRPLVLPHPALCSARAAGPSRRPAGPPLVGVHLRDLRPGVDGPGTVAVLAGALARLRAEGRAVAGRVWMHDRVRDPGARRRIRAACAADPALELVEQPRAGDHALEDQLTGLAAAVLPYRHGTHSGWLELCWDLGVPVAGPAVGHFADQHPEPDFYGAFRPGDSSELAATLERLLDAPEALAGGAARRRAQVRRRAGRAAVRTLVAERHLDLYRDLMREAVVYESRP